MLKIKTSIWGLSLFFITQAAFAGLKIASPEDLTQFSDLRSESAYNEYLSEASYEELRALHELNKLDFDPAADATKEDYFTDSKSFENLNGFDTSPFLKDDDLVIPVMAQGATYIDVNLSKNQLVFYQNGRAVLTTHISHGRAGKRTPTGTYSVGWKSTRAWSQKYSAAMPYALFFIGGKYAIHQGDTNGQSRGCVRVPAGTAAKLYSLVPTGTTVKIHY